VGVLRGAGGVVGPGPDWRVARARRARVTCATRALPAGNRERGGGD
jgi:hypothetical protein